MSCFGIFIGSRIAMSQVTKLYNPDIDCTYIDKAEYTNEENIYKEHLIQNKLPKILTFCYCQEKKEIDGLFEVTNIKIKQTYLNEVNEIKPCKEWLDGYLEYSAFIFVDSLIANILNTILLVLLKIFSAFQKNRTLTSEMYTVMRRKFYIQILNSGIIIVIINTNIKSIKLWSPNFPILTGKYSDFDPAWYAKIGINIVKISIYYLSI
jgi:hypothetical protein